MGNDNRDTELRIIQLIGNAWKNGWQPRELVRQIRRTRGAPELGLALLAIAADHRGRDASTIDARWVAQIEELDLATGPRAGWLDEWMQAFPLPPGEQLAAVSALLGSLRVLFPIAILIPPPGSRPGDIPDVNLTTKTNDPVLDRVRALLAQAESTQYEAEAETFTAKAQQLMTRHAIDMAMVAAGSTRSERPDTIRIPIDDPYIDAKSMLLSAVAVHSRCRTVWQPGYALASVVGFAADLDATQTLFTSLLVQAQVSLRAASASAPSGTHARSRGFRSAFLLAYGHRVGQRLDEINRGVVADAEAETGRSILPVLAARSARVDTAVEEIFGPLGRRRRRRGVDGAGWASGISAADRARLNAGDLDPAR